MTEIKLGYARVSTNSQSTDNQISKLTAAGCSELFVDDGVSGSKNHKSDERLRLLDRVKEIQNKGDTAVIIVKTLDRWSRSTVALLKSVEELASIGASFRTLDNQFSYDATSPQSKLLLTMLSALSEFERTLIIERTAEGIAAAVAKGLMRGNKPKLSSGAVKSIREQYADPSNKDSVTKIGKSWGVGRSTILRVLGIYGTKSTPYVTSDEWEEARRKSR